MTEPLEPSGSATESPAIPPVELHSLRFAENDRGVFVAEYSHEEEPGSPVVRLTVELADPTAEGIERTSAMLAAIKFGFTLVDPSALPAGDRTPPDESESELREDSRSESEPDSVEPAADERLAIHLALLRPRLLRDQRLAAAFVLAGLSFTGVNEAARAKEAVDAAALRLWQGSHNFLSRSTSGGPPLGVTPAGFTAVVGTGKVRVDPNNEPPVDLVTGGVKKGRATRVLVSRMSDKVSYTFAGWYG
jgi:hypothetical protein